MYLKQDKIEGLPYQKNQLFHGVKDFSLEDQRKIIERIFEHSLSDGVSIVQRLGLSKADLVRFLMSKKVIEKHRKSLQTLVKHLTDDASEDYDLSKADKVIISKIYKAATVKEKPKKLTPHPIQQEVSVVSKYIEKIDCLYSKYLKPELLQPYRPQDHRSNIEKQISSFLSETKVLLDLENDISDITVQPYLQKRKILISSVERELNNLLAKTGHILSFNEKTKKYNYKPTQEGRKKAFDIIFDETDDKYFFDNLKKRPENIMNTEDAETKNKYKDLTFSEIKSIRLIGEKTFIAAKARDGKYYIFNDQGDAVSQAFDEIEFFGCNEIYMGIEGKVAGKSVLNYAFIHAIEAYNEIQHLKNLLTLHPKLFNKTEISYKNYLELLSLYKKNQETCQGTVYGTISDIKHVTVKKRKNTPDEIDGEKVENNYPCIISKRSSVYIDHDNNDFTEVESGYVISQESNNKIRIDLPSYEFDDEALQNSIDSYETWYEVTIFQDADVINIDLKTCKFIGNDLCFVVQKKDRKKYLVSFPYYMWNQKKYNKKEKAIEISLKDVTFLSLGFDTIDNFQVIEGKFEILCKNNGKYSKHTYDLSNQIYKEAHEGIELLNTLVNLAKKNRKQALESIEKFQRKESRDPDIQKFRHECASFILSSNIGQKMLEEFLDQNRTLLLEFNSAIPLHLKGIRIFANSIFQEKTIKHNNAPAPKNSFQVSNKNLLESPNMNKKTGEIVIESSTVLPAGTFIKQTHYDTCISYRNGIAWEKKSEYDPDHSQYVRKLGKNQREIVKFNIKCKEIGEIKLPLIQGGYIKDKIVTERVKKYGYKKTLFHGKALNQNITVKPYYLPSEIEYEQIVPSIHPAPLDINSLEYEKFKIGLFEKDQTTKLMSQELVPFRELPIEFRLFLESIQNERPLSQLQKIESFCRSIFYYDTKNTNSLGDMTIPEMWDSMKQQLNEIIRKDVSVAENIQGQIYANVCNGNAQAILIVLLRASGFISRLESGWLIKEESSKVSDDNTHIRAEVLLPSSLGGNPFFYPIDGTAITAVNWSTGDILIPEKQYESTKKEESIQATPDRENERADLQPIHIPRTSEETQFTDEYLKTLKKENFKIIKMDLERKIKNTLNINEESLGTIFEAIFQHLDDTAEYFSELGKIGNFIKKAQLPEILKNNGQTLQKVFESTYNKLQLQFEESPRKESKSLETMRTNTKISSEYFSHEEKQYIINNINLFIVEYYLRKDL